jgi:glycosyltransferase involved in cell wall biosynthesis
MRSMQTSDNQAVKGQDSKVSVLMPSFNYGRYLPCAIESVLSQSHGDLELIIADDCSTDDSREIARRWQQQDKRVITVFHETNTGLSGARNSGLVHASGRYVALCDADDIWTKDKLTIELECFQRRPDLGAVHSDASIIDGEGYLNGKKYSSEFHGKNQKCSGDLFHDFCLRNFICNSTVVLRRECLDYAGGFDLRLRSLEDWVCWARISKKYAFGYVEQPLVMYRVHQTNLSRQVGAMAGYRVTAVNLLLEEAGDIPRSLRSKMLYSLGMAQMELADWPAAADTFRKAVREDIFNAKALARWVQASRASAKTAKYGPDIRET